MNYLESGRDLEIGAGKLLAAQLYGVKFWDPVALAVALVASTMGVMLHGPRVFADVVRAFDGWIALSGLVAHAMAASTVVGGDCAGAFCDLDVGVVGAVVGADRGGPGLQRLVSRIPSAPPLFLQQPAVCGRGPYRPAN